MSFSEVWWQFLLWAVVCYFVGCFNFAQLIAKLKHKDIRKIGSGNPGTMNMSREFGLKTGIITFFCDVFKGGIPCLIAFFVYKGKYFSGTEVLVSDFAKYFCGVFVVIGHIFPITMKFKGGKGIASTFGIFWISLACENPWLLLAGFAFFWVVAFYIVFTEWGSMGSLMGVTIFSITQACIFFVRYNKVDELSNPIVISLLLIILAINILTWGAHHQNIMRLLAGEEHHTSVKKMVKKKKKTNNA